MRSNNSGITNNQSELLPDDKYYIEQFKNAASLLDSKQLQKKQMELAVGLYGGAAFLKLFKKNWTSPNQDPLTAESRIFFSVWITHTFEEDKKLFYNIHAFKLRKLPGYRIESRKFADAFRKKFKSDEHLWENVSVQFGPLTLMEGWQSVDTKNLKKNIVGLAKMFLKIYQLVDDTLSEFKK